MTRSLQVLFLLLLSGFLGNSTNGQDVRWAIPKYGYDSANQEMYIGYDPMTHNPRFVVELMTDETLKVRVPRDNNPFHPNPLLPDDHRVAQQDYIGIGYDRGHMAPAANHQSSRDSLYATFQMDNITPQVPELNRGVWAAIEKSVRDKFRLGTYTRAWVVTLPLYFTDTDTLTIRVVGKRIWVPTHLAKTCLFLDASGSYTCLSYIVPNMKEGLRDTPSYYVTTVDEVESLSGLDFWVSLPKDVQDRIESVK